MASRSARSSPPARHRTRSGRKRKQHPIGASEPAQTGAGACTASSRAAAERSCPAPPPPQGSVRQVSSSTIPMRATEAKAACTSDSGKALPTAARADPACASTGKTRVTPAISTVWPAQNSKATSACPEHPDQYSEALGGFCRFFIRRLPRPHCRVFAIAREQFVMRAAFGHHAILQHQNTIGIGNR